MRKNPMGWWKLFNPRGESDQEPATSIPRFHGQVSAPQTPRTACRQPRPIAHTSPVSHRLLRRRQILCIPHLLPESTVPSVRRHLPSVGYGPAVGYASTVGDSSDRCPHLIPPATQKSVRCARPPSIAKESMYPTLFSVASKRRKIASIHVRYAVARSRRW